VLQGKYQPVPSVRHHTFLYKQFAPGPNIHAFAATGRLECLELSYSAASKHYHENQSSPAKAEKSLRRCINRRNTYGQTALMMACKHGHAEAVTWLLRKGADPMLFDSIHSRACLHYCALYGQSGCVEALFQSNVMVESVDGRQPLSQAQIVDSQGIHKCAASPASLTYLSPAEHSVVSPAHHGGSAWYLLLRSIVRHSIKCDCMQNATSAHNLCRCGDEG
jgi:hypothetical protein